MGFCSGYSFYRTKFKVIPLVNVFKPFKAVEMAGRKSQLKSFRSEEEKEEIAGTKRSNSYNVRVNFEPNVREFRERALELRTLRCIGKSFCG